MKGWEWLTGHTYNWTFLIRTMVKGLVLFGIVNALFAISNPLPLIGRLTIYNWLVPGRERLPYGESSSSYNLSLNSFEAMFSSHVVARPKANEEYRVLVMGDSSVWGVLLENTDTLTGQLNEMSLQIGDKTLKAYNLGHPIMSVTKDLMLLDYAVRYQPDLIVWMVTLESLPYPKQLDAPIVQYNAALIRALIERYELNLDEHDARLVTDDFWRRTIVGQRRALADWWRLQLYGVNWAATGIDQFYQNYELRSNDFDTQTEWQGMTEVESIKTSDLAFDILEVGQQISGATPLILVNEPIYIADGLNSDVRYNFWYPKWAYDRYRIMMAETAAAKKWHYVDLWDSVSPSEFTDSPVHLTAMGSAQLSTQIADIITRFKQ